MPLTFKLRENDIVESKKDLEQSAINNLSVFFDSLPLKLIYEAKLVQSITTQDGRTVYGKVQQVKVGKNKNGTTKYKTILNKFAVLGVFVLFTGQARKKLVQIVLAPVNIFKYKPDINELFSFGKNLNKLLKEKITMPGGSGTGGKQEINESARIVDPPIASIKWACAPEAADGSPAKQMFSDRQVEQYISYGYKIQNDPVCRTAPVVSNVVSAIIDPKANVSTLTEWYKALGEQTPNLDTRGRKYQELELGPADTYIGTGEQNIKFLNALKAEKDAKTE